MEWTRHKIPRIKDVLPLVNGLFTKVVYSFKYDIDKSKLDFLFLAKCGQRSPAPVIDVLHEVNEEDYDEMLTSSELQTLAGLLVMQYKQKWDKLGEIYDIEYDPIHNYLDQWSDESEENSEHDSTENVDRVDTLGTTVNRSTSRTDNLSQLTTKAGSDTTTRTDNLTSTETRNLTNSNTRTYDTDKHNTGNVTMSGNDTTTDSLWGFNSGSDVNADKSVLAHGQVQTNNLTEEMNGTVGDSGTEGGTRTVGNTGTQGTVVGYNSTVTVANTGTQGTTGSEATTGTNRRDNDTTLSETGSNTKERSGSHMGNIGNLTSQKQILEEIELWKWNYVEQILDDAKEFLTLPIYL